ncbi:acyltransferase family protein [Rhizobium metallidurans]|uniref:Surface polysaccharide O-acyltransferase-like enzyme n=1 Tax=Rhizobium metallidurans TaxID=1265931 RepID=A0A7W6CRR5_9HYPH|nr:acyltransferase [Rhizobium metallidurans]MBB3964979.1 surface polysaccharide O-acyltransferase-like enzyme [Rhizobium metallidurans]
MKDRLYYVDRLRISAFAILILYHSSAAFFPDMGWLIHSARTSPTLSLIMDFPRAWRLALLFFVSGMGAAFSFRSDQSVAFLYKRTIRLLVPLLFAMAVLLVPQVWYERMYEDGYDGSLPTFWVTRYFTEGRYPTGNFTWAHMWFVAYLLVMSVICYPIFVYLSRPKNRIMAWFERVAKTWAIYLFVLLPLALNLALSPIYPKETNALYNDGAWFAVWASWFGLGFLIARNHQTLIGPIIAKRFVSAAIALATTVFLYAFAWLAPAEQAIGSYANDTPLFKAAIFLLAWSMILTLVGFAARHFNQPDARLVTLNRLVFPLYIIHQTVVVAALYYVLPLGLPAVPSFLIIAAATFVLSGLFAIAVDFIPGRARLLFGLDAKPPNAAGGRNIVGAER